MSKFSIFFYRSFLVSFMRCFCSWESAEIDPGYARYPAFGPAIPKRSRQPRAIAIGYTLISHILRMSCFAKIAPSVVSSIAVDMIDNIVRPLSGHPKPRKAMDVIISFASYAEGNDRSLESFSSDGMNMTNPARFGPQLSCLRIVIVSVAQPLCSNIVFVLPTVYLPLSHDPGSIWFVVRRADGLAPVCALRV